MNFLETLHRHDITEEWIWMVVDMVIFLVLN